MHGKRFSSDNEGDGPTFMNEVRLDNMRSLDTWNDFYRKNMRYRGKVLYTCILAFDKHNVIDTLNPEEVMRFAVLRNEVNFSNNLGGALVVLSRGPSKWMQVLAKACSQVIQDDTWSTDGDRHDLTPKEYALFFQIAEFFIFTEKIEFPTGVDLSSTGHER